VSTLLLGFLIGVVPNRAADDAYTSLLGVANQLLKDGKLVEARQTATTATSLAPERFEAWFLAGAVAHQQGADAEAKPLIEKALTLAPEDRKAKIQQFLASVGGTGAATTVTRLDTKRSEVALTQAAQRELDTLLVIAEEADTATAADKRKAALNEFLEKSAVFLKQHPDQVRIWVIRAAAALELELEKTAKRAGQKLQELGLGESSDGKVRRVLAMLNRKGWLIPPVPATQKSDAWPQSDKPFENSLGMKFVPVAGTEVLFSIWITRERDYQPFVKETHREWPDPDWETPNFDRGPTHPAVMVSWNDAVAFCDWLTARERREGRIGPDQEYRLPTDSEWSVAVQLKDEAGGSPYEKSQRGAPWHERSSGYPYQYAWGTQYPPPPHTANLADESVLKKYGDVLRARLKARHEKFEPGEVAILSYNDGYPDISPVDAFPPNQLGLYDMGGNVEQWCLDWRDDEKTHRVKRGNAINTLFPAYTAAAHRNYGEPTDKLATCGFRCVLVTQGSEP
jgi:formylglycine-generating enzyme required for sulfatase activity